MRDLSQIEQQNSNAAQGEIGKATAAGKHVAAKYAGLHYLNHEVFDTLEQATARKAAIEAEGPSYHAKLFSPATAAA